MTADLPRGATGGSIEWGGRQRTYRLFVPSGYEPERPTPLVVVLHGGGGTAERTATTTGFDDEAERGGFIAVYPNGVTGNDGAQNWNDGREDRRYYPSAQRIDDVGFIAALLDRLAAAYTVDPARVYATGISNGGFMSYRLACDLADRFAAVAPVAATITAPARAPSRPVSVLHLHGTADRYVPYEGGVGISRTPDYRLMPVRDAIAFWRDRNGCAGDLETSEVGTAEELVTRETHRSCDGDTEVTLYTIHGGGHTWPGSATAIATAQPARGVPVGPVSTSVRATPLIWEFFATHPRR